MDTKTISVRLEILFLNLTLSVSNDIITSRFYDKRRNLGFEIDLLMFPVRKKKENKRSKNMNGRRQPTFLYAWVLIQTNYSRLSNLDFTSIE